MTPADVEALDGETYAAFVRYMNNHAREIEKQSKRRR